MPEPPPLFDAIEVIQIASKFCVDASVVVVGGQATNFWAWYYRASLDPTIIALTSVDIDYYGTPESAERIAEVLDGEVIRVGFDDATPNNAVVKATFNGKPLHIDILNRLLGVRPDELAQGASEITVATTVRGEHYKATIRVLHPLLCFKSRAANMVHPGLQRPDIFASTQLRASMAGRARMAQGPGGDSVVVSGHWSRSGGARIPIKFKYGTRGDPPNATSSGERKFTELA